MTLENGIQLPDPYSINEKEWTDDVLSLPDIQSLDVYQYLIETPSEFTKQSLRAYKSLEAYIFFVCGHVQDVFLASIEKTDFCFIKSSVLPSQR